MGKSKKSTSKPKAKSPSKVEKKTEISLQVWRCKDDWVNFRGKRYIRGQEIMLAQDSLNDNEVRILEKYFDKIEMKSETIISEPIELAEGE